MCASCKFCSVRNVLMFVQVAIVRIKPCATRIFRDGNTLFGHNILILDVPVSINVAQKMSVIPVSATEWVLRPLNICARIISPINQGRNPSWRIYQELLIVILELFHRSEPLISIVDERLKTNLFCYWSGKISILPTRVFPSFVGGPVDNPPWWRLSVFFVREKAGR